MAASPAKTIGIAALLALACLVFGRAVLRLVRGPQAPAAASGDIDAGVDDPLAETPAGQAGVDLLAAWGSFRPGTAVAQPFAAMDSIEPAAPAGEARTAPAGATGATPAPLDVSLVMLAGSAARAVVDGRVVGAGDRVAAGILKRIAPDGIEVLDGARTLFYELRRRWPRGHQPAVDAADANKREQR
jgi:hypothetical protein